MNHRTAAPRPEPGGSVCAGPGREQMAPESADFSALAEHSPLTHPHFLLSRAHPSCAPPVQIHPQPWAGMENALADRALGSLEWDTSPIVSRKPLHLKDKFIPTSEDPKHVLDSRPTTASRFPCPAVQIQPCQGSALAKVLLMVEGLCRVRSWCCKSRCFPSA